MTIYLFLRQTEILIGNDITYAEDSQGFLIFYVRVSLKGTCEEEFTKLTGAIPQGFQLQLKALEYLTKIQGKCTSLHA